uniref:Putative secreted protein n=1 Tax=Anopheles darlingi TaxID=43151 RepID=A0A2M4DH37_ANODA
MFEYSRHRLPLHLLLLLARGRSTNRFECHLRWWLHREDWFFLLAQIVEQPEEGGKVCTQPLFRLLVIHGIRGLQRSHQLSHAPLSIRIDGMAGMAGLVGGNHYWALPGT